MIETQLIDFADGRLIRVADGGRSGLHDLLAGRTGDAYHSQSMLLERDVELADLDRQLRAVREGAGRVIVVEGPAGIGKSSLLASVARSAEARGETVLRARGGPLELDSAWGIARQLFAPVHASARWRELAIGAAGLARRVLDPDAPEPAPAGDAMHAAVHGLTWLASNLAERSPALLVVDDVHWADAPSLRWLAQLSRRLDELALGVLCAVRAGEPANEPELLAELLAAAPEEPLRPRPLSPAAAEALVRDRLPAADATFAHACHGVTGGNPFLLSALLTKLVAERIAPTSQVAAGLTAFGPEQVARSVERQLARLPDGAVALARACAVLGRGAPLRHAARLAGLEPDAAARLADALRAAGLIARDGGLAHPLVASALYGSLAAGERSLWHAHAARLLASERADPEAVALHLLHTDPAADGESVEALRAAARRADARGAPESASGFLRRALAEPPLDRSTAAEVRAELGLALAAHVHPDAPRLLGEAIDWAASAKQRAELALRGARALSLAGQLGSAIELCRRALGESAIREAAADARLAFDYKLHVAPIPVVLFALQDLVNALTELNEPDAADAALAAAGQLGDPPAGALAAPLALQSRARLRLTQRRHAEAYADLLAAASRWDELGVRHCGFASWRVDAAEALVALGDTPAARRLAEEHLQLAERVGLPRPRAAGLRALARTAAPAERIALLERSAALLTNTPCQLEHTRALIDLGAALRRANRRADAHRPLRHALELAERGGMRLLADRAHYELHACGARPRRIALSGVGALTPAEYRVATLAAQGYNNREIAEQLYVTRRTVETHLTHAFQKLDITTRTELHALLDGNSEHRHQRRPA